MLTSLMPEGLAVFIECVVIGVCIVLMYAILAIILIYMERKVCAFFQCRLGPNRVGKYGSLQVFCDVFKMLTKEIFTPKGADRFLYNLAPYMVILASFLTFACLPMNKGLEVLDFNVGIFFLLAASSIGVVGILLEVDKPTDGSSSKGTFLQSSLSSSTSSPETPNVIAGLSTYPRPKAN